MGRSATEMTDQRLHFVFFFLVHVNVSIPPFVGAGPLPLSRSKHVAPPERALLLLMLLDSSGGRCPCLALGRNHSSFLCCTNALSLSRRSLSPHLSFVRRFWTLFSVPLSGLVSITLLHPLLLLSPRVAISSLSRSFIIICCSSLRPPFPPAVIRTSQRQHHKWYRVAREGVVE